MLVCRQDAAAARCGEFVVRANRAREAVARLHAALRASPLGGKDYDDFPLQEDALAVIISLSLSTRSLRYYLYILKLVYIKINTFLK